MLLSNKSGSVNYYAKVEILSRYKIIECPNTSKNLVATDFSLLFLYKGVD